MRIDVRIDADKLIAKTLKAQKNLAYSTAQALNDTAKDIQAQVQGRVKALFRIRKGGSSEFSEKTGDQPSRSERSFIVRQIRVFSFASVKKGLIYAEIGIANKPRLLLSKFETGGTRTPFVGKNVAVPTSEVARGGSINNPVEDDLTFRKLAFKKIPNRSGRDTLDAGFKSGLGLKEYKNLAKSLGSDQYQIKGRQRTFILKKTDAHPLGGVYQRTGPRREDIRMVYSFRRAFRIQKVLSMIETAREEYAKRFRENFTARFIGMRR